MVELRIIELGSCISKRGADSSLIASTAVTAREVARVSIAFESEINQAVLESCMAYSLVQLVLAVDQH